MRSVFHARRKRTERGASAVEFALVMPLLLTILFGLITLGLAFSDHLSATNATREGARYGAAANVSASTWATDVKDRVKQVYFNESETVSDNQICVSLIKADGTTAASYAGGSCGATPALPDDMDPGTCAVVVWMQRPRTIQLLVVPSFDIDIRAESVAYYSRVVTPTCTAA